MLQYSQETKRDLGKPVIDEKERIMRQEFYGSGKRPNKVSCTTCGRPIGWPGTNKCDGCWEVESRLKAYLGYPKGQEFVRKALAEVVRETSPAPHI